MMFDMLGPLGTEFCYWRALIDERLEPLVRRRSQLDRRYREKAEGRLGLFKPEMAYAEEEEGGN